MYWIYLLHIYVTYYSSPLWRGCVYTLRSNGFLLYRVSLTTHFTYYYCDIEDHLKMGGLLVLEPSRLLKSMISIPANWPALRPSGPSLPWSIHDSLCTLLYVGWRPAFRYYNQWIALVGALLCVAIMFVIRWYYALVTIVLVGFLYMVVSILKPGNRAVN